MGNKLQHGHLDADDGGTLSVNAMPVGCIVQVVSATQAGELQTTSSTYVTTGLTATITPTRNTNKILVIVHLTGLLAAGSNTFGAARLVRGSTQLIEFEKRFAENPSQVGVAGAGCTYLDSPATVSATTYTVEYKRANGTSSVYVMVNDCTATITLLEVQA